MWLELDVESENFMPRKQGERSAASFHHCRGGSGFYLLVERRCRHIELASLGKWQIKARAPRTERCLTTSIYIVGRRKLAYGA
jgi:hypothetical protein